MKGKLKINIARSVCWIILLQTINISVNPWQIKQWKSGRIVYKEDLSINNFETIYELIAETCFDVDIQETEEEDTDQKVKTLEVYCFNPEMITPYFKTPLIIRRFFTNSSFYSLNFPPDSPPPQRMIS